MSLSILKILKSIIFNLSTKNIKFFTESFLFLGSFFLHRGLFFAQGSFFLQRGLFFAQGVFFFAQGFTFLHRGFFLRSTVYPHTPGKGVYKPENFVKFFTKIYPLTPCNYFCENGILKNCSTNEYMNEFVVILK